jgi:biopolymer transport protein ExbD
MQLARPRPPQRVISLVPMIDVLLIMLVFFMVTSTYLNLAMIPVVNSSDAISQATPAATNTGAPPLIIRLGSDGQPRIRGQSTSIADLSVFLASQVAEYPDISVLIWPAPRAATQSLVTLMDTLTTAGINRLRILHLSPIE